LGHKEIKYGTEQGDFLGQEKLTYGHNKTNFGSEQGDFFGTGEVDFESLQDELWDIRMCFLGQEKLIFGS
jgi:hypothetical protein